VPAGHDCARIFCATNLDLVSERNKSAPIWGNLQRHFPAVPAESRVRPRTQICRNDHGVTPHRQQVRHHCISRKTQNFPQVVGTGHPAKQAMARHHINAHAQWAETSQKPMMVSVQSLAEGKGQNAEDEDRLRSGLAKSSDLEERARCTYAAVQESNDHNSAQRRRA
jgi:hypothetical protein